MSRPRERAKELAEQFRVPPHNHDDRYARRDELQDHLDDTADAHDASAISILDTANDFTATDVEGALAELQADAEAHLADTSDAHDASAISFTPAGDIAADDVQEAIEELDTEKATEANAVMDGDAAGGVLAGTYPNPSFASDMATQAELDAHINDTTDAHDASAISVADTSSGPNSGGTFASDNSNGGAAAWSDPANAGASDNSNATAESTGGVQVTEYLKATGFNFTVPRATITGISVTVERRRAGNFGSSTVTDDAVRIVKGGAVGSTDRSSGSNWPTSDAIATYGGATDLWGESWTAEDINGSTFGFAIAASVSDLEGARIDHVTITVHYELGDEVQTAIDTIAAELEDLRSAAWPVGSVFISVVSTNPATLLGFGTWVAFATGRTLVGIDSGQTEFDTVEETGGAKTHTLTTNEMPAHTHDIAVATAAASGSNRQHPSGAPTGTFATNSAGGGAAHNNLQPYIVTYMFKRTA